MRKFEELVDKRNLEIELERKVIETEKSKLEFEKEIALKEKQKKEAAANLNRINYTESVALGILYGIIGAFIGFMGGGLIGLALWLIIMIFGSDYESIISIVGVIGLIIGGLGGFWMGYDERRE